MTNARVLACALATVLLASPVSLRAGDADKGKELFGQCSMCHYPDKTEKKMGPGLKGLFHRDTLTNGKKVTDENVMAVVKEGGNGMPAYKDILTDEERDNVLAYLKTL